MVMGCRNDKLSTLATARDPNHGGVSYLKHLSMNTNDSLDKVHYFAIFYITIWVAMLRVMFLRF